MIIIQAEDGSIITDPREIYIDNDLDGRLHLYADLSNTDRVKAVKLTVFSYSKNELWQMLETMYKTMEYPYYVISMKEVLNIAKQDRMEVSHG